MVYRLRASFKLPRGSNAAYKYRNEKYSVCAPKP